MNNKKTKLYKSILPKLKEQGAYFSLAAVRAALKEEDVALAEETLWEYMSGAMVSGIVYDTGRGWYSRHEKSVTLDPAPLAVLIKAVKKTFPLLDFNCWSTLQFNPFAQHLIAQPTLLLYAESDTLEAVAETLTNEGWQAWANPRQADVERFVRPGEKTVVLRPSVSKQPEDKDHAVPIEKSIVDLFVETEKLKLMDRAEVQGILDSILKAGLMQIPTMLGYAERRKQEIKSEELTR